MNRSPGVVFPGERIRINGQPLSEQLYCKYFQRVYNAVMEEQGNIGEQNVTYFLLVTLMGFLVFIDYAVDVAILEVGIGGEYDRTNAIRCARQFYIYI